MSNRLCADVGLHPLSSLLAGESIVRQLLFGQRFFAREFGSRCGIFWLPDTFGYSAQLPQLIASAGMKYFVSLIIKVYCIKAVRISCVVACQYISLLCMLIVYHSTNTSDRTHDVKSK